MIFFTADTHFGHANVIKHDDRPFKTVEEMDKAIIDNWNSVVGDKDEVWHLGDFCFRSALDPASYFKQLNGKIHFARGNHDEKGADKIRHLFASYQDYKYLKFNDQKIVLFHYSMRVWRSSHHGAWHLYGHSHGGLPPHGKSLDVGLMNHNYRPISFDEVKVYMDKQVSVGHHEVENE